MESGEAVGSCFLDVQEGLSRAHWCTGSHKTQVLQATAIQTRYWQIVGDTWHKASSYSTKGGSGSQLSRADTRSKCECECAARRGRLLWNSVSLSLSLPLSLSLLPIDTSTSPCFSAARVAPRPSPASTLLRWTAADDRSPPPPGFLMAEHGSADPHLDLPPSP